MVLYGIDIFSGAGGLSLGAEMAGIKIAHAVEINLKVPLVYSCVIIRALC